MKWFRIHHSLFDDNTYFKRLTDSERYKYLHLYFLASKAKERNGNLLLDDEGIAYELRCQEEDWLTLKAKLKVKGFIDIFPWGISICAWSEDQYASDSSTERVKKHRESKKKQSRNTSETLQGVPVTEVKRRVTPPDTDTDTYSDTESEEEIKERKSGPVNQCLPDEMVDPLAQSSMPSKPVKPPVISQFSAMQFEEFWQYSVPHQARSGKGAAKKNFMEITGIDYKTFNDAFKKAVDAYVSKNPNEKPDEKFKYFKRVENWILTEGWLDFVPEHFQGGAMNLDLVIKSLPKTFRLETYVILPDGDWRINTSLCDRAELANFSMGSYRPEGYRRIYDIEEFREQNPDAVHLAQMVANGAKS